MFICMVTPDPVGETGGLELATKRIANFLADGGHKVHLVRASEDCPDDHWETKKGTITKLEGWRPEITLYDVTPYYSYPETENAWHEVYKGLERLSRENDYDVYHAFNISRVGFITGHMARRFKKKFIASGRGSDINRKILSSQVFPHIEWTLRNADRLTFMSEDMLERADAITPCREKSTVIYNSVNPDDFIRSETPPEVPGLCKDAFVIGGAGNLSEKKGQEVLTLAFKELKKKRPEAQLLWIGTWNPNRKLRFREELVEMVEAGDVIITGHVPHEQMLDYLSLLDVFVLASPDEGCPNVLLEASLFEVPSVLAVQSAMEVIEPESGHPLVCYDHERLSRCILDIEQAATLKKSTTTATERKRWDTLYHVVCQTQRT